MSAPDPLITAADTIDGNVTEGGVTETMLEALKARTSRVIKVTETLGDFDFSTGEPPYSVIYAATGYVYYYQADDTTTADDGLTCLVSADGKRYQIADSSALAISSVLAMQNVPPGSPAVNDAYVVDVAPTGAWVGHAKDIALYTKRGWVFGQAKPGDAVLNQTTSQNIQYSALGVWGAMATSITSGGVAPGQLLFPMGLSVEAQQNAPPASPVAGDGLYYLVGLTPSGAWSGKANKIATYDSTSTWVFLDPYAGAKIYNKAGGSDLEWNDAAGEWRPASLIAGIVQGRLTLATAVPVTTTDQTAKATLYFTPFRGDRIALYSNSAWSLIKFTEKSLSLSGYTTGKCFDIFGYLSSGDLALESLVWTSDLVRATALTLQDGYYVKSGDPTRRYLGTIYTTATGQTEDSYLKRNVSNYYNQVGRPMVREDTGTSWTLSGATYRQMNNSAANQLECVVGVSEDPLDAEVLSSVTSSSTAHPAVAVGINSTTVVATGTANNTGLGAAVTFGLSARWQGFVTAGRNVIAALETAGNSASVTFTGPAGMSGNVKG